MPTLSALLTRIALAACLLLPMLAVAQPAPIFVLNSLDAKTLRRSVLGLGRQPLGAQLCDDAQLVEAGRRLRQLGSRQIELGLGRIPQIRRPIYVCRRHRRPTRSAVHYPRHGQDISQLHQRRVARIFNRQDIRESQSGELG